MLKPRHEVLAAMILAAAMSRLVPHPYNFAPIGALALFGGAQFADRRLAFLMPCAALLLSDLVLGLYAGMGWIYGSFALIVAMGRLLRRRRTAWHIAGASVSASLLFFAVTNFAVWPGSTKYPQSLAGLMDCYAAGLPFFWNTLLGDGFYCLVLFGGFALLEQRFQVLREDGVPSPA
ncbi:MAG TPA: DUF6580 family putative transport protein [Gammaproteobacteria bacterium]